MSRSFRPRIAVELSPEMYDAITTLAEANGISRAKYLRGTLELAEPALLRMAELLKLVERVSDEDQEMLQDRFSIIENQLAELIEKFSPEGAELLSPDVSEKGQAPRAAQAATPRSASAGAPGQPPYTNRGVPSTPKGDEI